MTKTVAELRNEIKEEQIGVIVGLAKDNIKEIDKKIKDRIKWMSRRQRQINALESLFGQLEKAIAEGDEEAMFDFVNLVADAEETA